ncbi:hypothetical protein [Clostridium rectalis]|nr:hypothetical protein [Clostridium rectalis]
MLYKEDFYSLKNLSIIIFYYANLDDKDEVLNSINQMRTILEEIEKEFKK